MSDSVGILEERRKSPMGVKTAGIINASDGATVHMWWFKARNIPKYDASFQKVGSHRLHTTCQSAVLNMSTVHSRIYIRFTIVCA